MIRSGFILKAPDADAETGGGGSVDEATADAEMVTITRTELAELRDRAARAAGLTEARAEWAELQRTRDLAHEREVADSQRRASDLERSYKAALRDRELATALVGQALVPGAAAQLICLWRDAFEVIDDDGSTRVVSKEGRGIDQAVHDRLSSPEFAHFCLPTSRGGTAQRGPNRSAASAPPPPVPRTLGEAILHQWRTTPEATAPQHVPGWGRRR